MNSDRLDSTAAAQPSHRWRLTDFRHVAGYAGLSVLLLLPCFWQPRIQAGDLSSHIYNSWLAQLIETTRLDGLVLVSQTTNVLFDLILGGLFRMAGPEAAQRMAVSLTVLIFVWGSFVFTCVVSRRRPWHLMPCIAMLAYGWVFHMGFFNFYLSLGLCFWAMAALWRPNRIRLAAAALLLVLAYTAHALPVAWTVALYTYVAVARRLSPRRRVYLTATSIVLMIVANRVLSGLMVSHWSTAQMSSTTGADQMWVFGVKYYLVLVGLLLAWGILFLDLMHRRGAPRIVFSIPFQLCVLSAAVVATLPSMILFPGFHHAIVFIAERMSLGVGICVCAMLAAARARHSTCYGISALAAIFFFFLYTDELALNRFEDRMEGVVAQLPAGARVVSAIGDPTAADRTTALSHVIDRVCIRHCFSYGNYEASTAQFRIRAVAQNSFVAARYADSVAMQTGRYVVKESDTPLYEVSAGEAGDLVVRKLKAGSECRSTWLRIFPGLSFAPGALNGRASVPKAPGGAA